MSPVPGKSDQNLLFSSEHLNSTHIQLNNDRGRDRRSHEGMQKADWKLIIINLTVGNVVNAIMFG